MGVPVKRPLSRDQLQGLGKAYQDCLAKRIAVVRIYSDRDRCKELWETYRVFPSGRRKTNLHPGVSGKIERGETDKQAAEREIWEELGIKLTIPSQMAKEEVQKTQDNIICWVSIFDLVLPRYFYQSFYEKELPDGGKIRFDWHDAR